MQAIAKMTKAGQISIPIEIRTLLGLRGGDYVLVDVVQRQDVAEKQLTEQGNAKAPCPAWNL